FLHVPPPPTSPLFPYTTLFRSLPAGQRGRAGGGERRGRPRRVRQPLRPLPPGDVLLRCRRRLHRRLPAPAGSGDVGPKPFGSLRSEEHTSELQSRGHLVCRLLL